MMKWIVGGLLLFVAWPLIGWAILFLAVALGIL
jgi:hypothetical protein